MLLILILWVVALAGAVGMSYFLFKISTPVAKVGVLRIAPPGRPRRER